jgi:hypothetical protein
VAICCHATPTASRTGRRGRPSSGKGPGGRAIHGVAFEVSRSRWGRTSATQRPTRSFPSWRRGDAPLRQTAWLDVAKELTFTGASSGTEAQSLARLRGRVATRSSPCGARDIASRSLTIRATELLNASGPFRRRCLL